MTHAIALYVAISAALAAVMCVVSFVVDSEFRAGRRAFHDGEALDAGWTQPKRDGWSAAWGEQLQARLGYRREPK